MDCQDIASCKRQELVFYGKHTPHRNEWLLVSADADNYWFYTGMIGIEFAGEYGADGFKSRAIHDPGCFREYPSFLVIPAAKMREYCQWSGDLVKLLPDEIRNDPRLTDWHDIRILAKRHEKYPVTLEDIHDARNVELRQWVLEQYGFERYLLESGRVLDRDGESLLVENEEGVYLALKDASTPRRYVLQVPPEMETVREAVAWTFGMTANQYQPMVET